MVAEDMVQQKNGLSGKILAGMSYLGILCLVPLIINRDDSYVRFHARQGVILWMWEILAVYSLMLPAFGKVFFRFSGMMCVALSVVGLVAVILGRAWKFPVIGDWAEKL